MPQRPEFDLTSESLVPLLDSAGVIESIDSSSPERYAMLGAYYDQDPEFAGIYIVPMSGEVKYFDYSLNDVESVGISEDLMFGTYTIRHLQAADGEWLSEIKTELPIEVLYRIVISSAADTIEKLINVDLPDQLPSFESLYVYYDEKLNRVMSLVYLSTYGTYSRVDADWVTEDISVDTYQYLETIEIKPSMADELIDIFDEKMGNISVEEAKKFVNDVLEEGEQVG